jgi:TolB protein
MKRRRFRSSRIFILLSLIWILFSVYTRAEARVYIDISSPAFRQIPTAIYEFTGAPEGGAIADIIKDDLLYSGVFYYVDSDAYIESPLPVFDPQNWTPLGVEVVIKGTLNVEGGKIKATLYLYDVVEARKTTIKFKWVKKTQLRSLAHAIADAIYERITGERGAFRTRIAFVGEEGGKRGIYIMDWDGKRLRSTGISGKLLLTPHWSIDGKKLIYSSERGRMWGIFLADFERRTERKLISNESTNITGDFLPDGAGFLFSSSKKGSPDIYIYFLKRDKIKRITRWRGIEISPAISPDGRKVAFVSDRGGSPQIYIMSINGRDIRRLTFKGGYNTSPVWSPRGDRIAYSGRINGKHQIFIINPDGTDPVQLTEKGNNEDPSFSPNGRFIAFTSDRKGGRAVYIMRSNGEGVRRVTPIRMKAYGPRWSPR